MEQKITVIVNQLNPASLHDKKYKRTHDLNEASCWIKEGENVFVKGCRATIDGVENFTTERIIHLVQLPNNQILARDEYLEEYIFSGFIKNPKKIQVDRWLVLSNDRVYSYTSSAKVARHLVKNGCIVKAESACLQTDVIIRFNKDNHTFETYSGNIYKYV